MKDPRFAEHLAVFVDVVRTGSFSAASRRRHMTPSAIVRQIDALEACMGVTLLVRSTRALAVTDAGRLMFEKAQPILDELVDLQAEVTGMENTVTGVLRVACFPTFGKRYVIPVAEALMEKHADLRVELDLTERLADPVLERLDAVIRIGHLQDSTLISSKLSSQRRLFVASPSYLGKHGLPDLGALGDHRFLDKLHGQDLLGWRDILGCDTTQLTAGATVFRCDDFEALRDAALRGMGLAFLPEWVIGPDVREGRLTKLPADPSSRSADAGIYILRALTNPPAKLRAFTTGLKELIGTVPIWSHDAL